MTIEDKKLAEKILEQNLGFITCCKDKSDSVNNAIVKPIIEAMEQYYHAKLAKITDADIHKWIFENNPVEDGDDEWLYGYRQGLFSGAKLFRDVEIKHIDR